MVLSGLRVINVLSQYVDGVIDPAFEVVRMEALCKSLSPVHIHLTAYILVQTFKLMHYEERGEIERDRKYVRKYQREIYLNQNIYIHPNLRHVDILYTTDLFAKPIRLSKREPSKHLKGY